MAASHPGLWRRLWWWLSFCVGAGVVAGCFVIVNLRTLDPSHERKWEYGWPCVVINQDRMLYVGSSLNRPVRVVSFEGKWAFQNVSRFCVNLAIGCILSFAAGVSFAYFTGKQFSLRTLFGIITALCILLALAKSHEWHLYEFVFVPIWLSVGCLVVIVGIFAYHWSGRRKAGRSLRKN